jgi:hypothetical protein
MRRQTILNQDLLQILRAFLIDEVDVEPYLENGNAFIPEGEILDSPLSEKTAEIKQSNDFEGLYRNAVLAFKQLYLDWQSGALVDISKIRNLLIPAAEQGLKEPREIFKTYNYGDTIQVAMAGLLCDCGMTKIEQGFLTKKTALTDKEFKELKQHPVYSYKMLNNIVSLKEAVKLGVLQHHERLDGSGYPLGAKADQLHIFGKIAALAHAYQAMVSERPHRSKQSPFKVLEQLMQDEFGKFDLTALNELKKGLLKLSSGTNVRLSDGRIAEIVFIEDQYPTRPLIKIEETEEILALKEQRHLFIKEII